MKEEYKRDIKSFVESLRLTAEPEAGLLTGKYLPLSRLKSAGIFYEKAAGLLRGEFTAPAVGYVCNMVPEELIMAAGAVPVRLCSQDRAFSRAGEEVMPAEICPLVKSTLGSILSESRRGLDMVLVPAACDAKIKLAQLIEPFRETLFVDLPRDSDYLKNADAWVAAYRVMFDRLRRRYDRKAGRKELLKACRMTNRRTEAFRKLFDFRAENPGKINSYDYFTACYASFIMTPEEWARAAETLVEEAASADGGDRRKRILLSGSPVMPPNYKILEVLEESGCDVSADTLCSAYGRLYDPVVIDEKTETGLIRSIALKYVAASMCPCFLSMDRLTDRIIELVQNCRLRGVVYHTLRLCQVFDIQAAVTRRMLKRRGIPALFLKTDLNPEDTGQLKTRVEAFREMLE